MARIITTNLDDILDLINAADVYGFNHPTLIGSLFSFIGNKLSDDEIKEFAATYNSPDMIKLGYCEEDVEDITDTLTKLRDKYCK